MVEAFDKKVGDKADEDRNPLDLLTPIFMSKMSDFDETIKMDIARISILENWQNEVNKNLESINAQFKKNVKS